MSTHENEDGTQKYSDAFKKLLQKRDNLVKSIMSHEEKIKEGSVSKTMATTRLLMIENSFKKYSSLMEKVVDHADYDPDHLQISNSMVENSYCESVAKFNEVIDASTDRDQSMSLQSTMATRSNENTYSVKLPPISIPTFTGKQLEWTTFYDTFSSLVDQNNSIQKINKLHYLRDSLKGEAFKTISKIPTSEANYDVAWQLLQDKYHNKRAIVNDCLKTLLFQDPITKHNASQIRNVIDTSNECVLCIETMDVDIDNWDPFLVYVLQTKLDKETALEWEKKLGGSKEIPKYKEMMDFLETQYRIVNTPSSFQESSQKMNATKFSKNDHKKVDHCKACEGDHYVLFCDKFNAWPVEQRKKFVDDNNLCTVCIKQHALQDCKSRFRCKTCNGKHSTKLHDNNAPSTASGMYAVRSTKHQKLLATAIVKVKDKFGADHLLRALIDNGSQGTVISEKAAQLLCLPRKREEMPMCGLDDKPLGKAKCFVRLQVQSVAHPSFIMSLDAFVMRSIMSSGPEFRKQDDWNHLKGLQLADPEFMIPSEADILFGVDVHGIIVTDGIKKGKIHEPIAQNSEFGWLVLGAACDKKDSRIRIHSLSLELKKFWETEEVELPKIMTDEHQKCAELCNASTVRLPNGKLQVSLPFNMDRNDPNFLGDSRKMAMRRYFQLEKKFEKNPEYYERYKLDMLSYLEEGHMRLSHSPLNNGYYFPHHAVTREESTTTKQRTVFDGSAKTTNGYSLNDRCFNGPTIQPELFDIFTRFRMHKIALVADLAKMYRQFSVAPEDRKYQKILFRFSKDEPIQTYELNTVTFGVKPAPFMAINATFCLADMEKDRFPEAAKRVKTDFYVDDCMSGNHSTETAKNLQKELSGLFNSAGLTLRKWASNSEEALEGIPPENRAISQSLTLQTTQTVKTLGMKWTPSTDLLSFTIDLSRFSFENLITKRKLISDASKLYDPCGLLAPITIKAKILMQSAFKEKIDWDEKLTNSIQNEWNAYRDELPQINQIKIQRWLQYEPTSEASLHGFCDASDGAFAAAVYLVQTSKTRITSHLICSKTRVAPIDPLSTPRLELCGAVLLANLATRVMKNFKIAKENVHLWTDSSVVWHWLQSHPSRFAVYVAHRVHEIQKLYPATHWKHVRTHENPADIASRGVSASQLVDNSLWFFGPAWLIHGKTDWPNIFLPLPSEINLEERPTRLNLAVTVPQEMQLLTRFSSLTRLLRVTARILRLKSKNKRDSHFSSSYVTGQELLCAKLAWVKYVQSLHFAKEIHDLKTKKSVSEKSALRLLNPIFNEHGILVVDGRLRYADLPETQKQPMILPAKTHLTQLILKWAHSTTLHGTIHLTLARVRQEFWLLNGRNMVKSFVHNCIPCFRQKPRRMDQLMAPLPAIKTKRSRAFLHCGLDFAGPIEIKSSNLRKAPTEKAYICVFVCMASRSAHLELVGDLSTQRFILALKRMMARRGLCSDIYCDQGTNFQGASNELPRLFLDATSTESNEIVNEFASDKITFHFNPPSAPSWGGQWESFVKLTKHHLNRTSTSVRLTFEEMTTLLAQIEACLNSRPLCALTSDINDLDPLTPGHLIIGEPLNVIPEPSLLSVKDNTLDRFQSIQKGVQTFWKRFYGEYLHAQHPRKKWHKAQKDIDVNDLVVVIDDNLPPAKWRMARVMEVHSGKDGYVRMVTLKTQTSTIQRPIVKVCKLPLVNAREDVPDQNNK